MSDFLPFWNTSHARERYWKNYFPWELAWELAQGNGTILANRFFPTNADGDGWVRHPTYTSWKQWSRMRAGPETLSVDVIPPPDRYLVFDLDVRENKKHRPTCVLERKHDEADLCTVCWASHVTPALYVLERLVEHGLGIPSKAALHVFSGSNGVHVWYRTDLATPALQEAFATSQPLRDLLVHHTDGYLAHPRLPELKSIQPWPIWDVNATVDVFHDPPKHWGHPIKFPFSLHHRTGRIAMPIQKDELPTHLRTGADPYADYRTGHDLYFHWLRA